MMETVETLEDVFAVQARLNRKKWILNQRTNQAMQDWLKLADEYAEIDSRANHAYCMNKAVAYGYTVEAEAEQELIPEPEFPQWLAVFEPKPRPIFPVNINGEQMQAVAVQRIGQDHKSVLYVDVTRIPLMDAELPQTAEG